MSTTLVRLTLDILHCDKDVKRGEKKPSKSKGISHVILHNRKINAKQTKQEAKIFISRSSRIAIEAAKLQLSAKSDQTEKNIETLLRLSGNRIDPETSDKLFNRALKKRYCGPKNTESVKPEQTLFTEADFKEFEKEYIDE